MAVVLLIQGRSEVPRFPVRTTANTRRDRPMIVQSPPEFERGLGEVAWFANLGQPSPWDEGCARFYAWDQWPGPENGPGEALALTSQDMRDRIFAASPRAADALQTLFDRIGVIVKDRARTTVPFDPEADAWHGPTQCVRDAAYVAGWLGACWRAAGWSLMIWWNCGTGSKLDTGRQASPTSPATGVTYSGMSLLSPAAAGLLIPRLPCQVVTGDPRRVLLSRAAALEHP
jgi:hypothetical protein